MRVLVVDDTRFQRKVFTKMVIELGHEAIQAENGRQALDVIRSEQIDFLLTDLVMPEMTGDELVEALRAEGYALPVVVISADRDDTRVANVRSKIQYFLQKPFKASDLKAAITVALENQQGSGGQGEKESA